MEDRLSDLYIYCLQGMKFSFRMHACIANIFITILRMNPWHRSDKC